MLKSMRVSARGSMHCAAAAAALTVVVSRDGWDVATGGLYQDIVVLMGAS